MNRGSKMVIVFLHLMLVIISAQLVTGADAQDECTESRCSPNGPAIRFPFRLKANQPVHCGYPGFDLICSTKNQTVLELPSSVKLLVKTINYTSHEIQVYDENNCLPRQLPYLNLSLSAFQFQLDYLSNYTFFNCSAANTDEDDEVRCLRTVLFHVLAVYPGTVVSESPYLLSCSKMYDIVSIPDEILYQKVVPLIWSTSICEGCEEQGQRCRLKTNNSTRPETECFGVPKPAKASPLPPPSPPPPPPATRGIGASTRRLVITGAVLGFFLLVLIILVLYKAHRSGKRKKKNQLKIEKFLEDYKALKPTRYSYADVKRITNRFKEKLGQGGYGTVFKGKLSNEILVAVKLLNDSMGNGEEFINEVRTMGTIHHVNVVRLVGFCADGFKRALVYEFLPNDSLEKFIFLMDDRRCSLSWEKLQDIAIGIAKGIEYLHQGCDQQILHFDIKPHNILLDHNFSPKISDFGLAKLCSKGQSAVSMTVARGTMGYIAPEMISRNFGNVSYKSDVYSFGMLLLEMVGGRKNIDVKVENTSQVYFPEWIYDRLNQGEELHIRIEEEGDAKITKKLTVVGLRCIQWYPIDRPSMKVVLQMLEGDGENLIIPPNPFTSTIQTNSTAIMPEKCFNRELAVIPES